MKILHVVTAFPRDDDDVITPWLGQLLLAQRAAGLEAQVLAPAYRGGGSREWRGVPVHRFRYAPARFETLTHDETVPDRLRSRKAYAALLPGYLLGGTLAAFRVPAWKVDVLHIHWPVPHAWFGAVGRALCGPSTALVSSFYSVELRWIERSLPVLTPLLRWTIESADAVTAISTSTARHVRRHVDRDVHVIPFAAATGGGGMVPDMRPARTTGPFRILFVGRLVERKGVEVLVHALRRLEPAMDARLTIVGTGPSEDAIRGTAERLGLQDRVRLRGRVDDVALLEAYRSADVFVLPAVVDSKGDTEGLGVVLLEALREGCPVIASDLGGIPDIVRDGETGWLVPPGDADALANAITDVASGAEEVERRVANGRALVDGAFSMDGIVTALTRCYSEALRAREGHADESSGAP